MKRVFLIGEVDFSNESEGVTQKVFSQIVAFRNLGAEIDCIGYSDNHIIVTHFDSIGKASQAILGDFKNPRLKRFSLWPCAKKYIKNKKYDLAYIRYPIIDFFVLSTFRTIKDKCCYVVMEVPSYPLEDNSPSMARKIQFKLDNLLHDKCKSLIDKILYIGNKTDYIFGCNAIQIPNGIPDKIKCLQSTGYRIEDNCINLISVSNMYPIHGYDRIIKGLAEYYSSEKISYRVNLTLVGDGPCKKDYEELVERHHLEKYVRFTGMLMGEKLTDEYNKATIGLGSLAMFREGFNEASSLKTKEYLIRGLPFVYAVDEIGLDVSFPYALKIDNDNQIVSIDAIIEFVNSLICKSPDDVKKEMRDYAINRFDWKIILNNTCGEYL